MGQIFSKSYHRFAPQFSTAHLSALIFLNVGELRPLVDILLLYCTQSELKLPLKELRQKGISGLLNEIIKEGRAKVSEIEKTEKSIQDAIAATTSTGPGSIFHF